MRWICWASALLAVSVLASPAAGLQAMPGGQMTYAGGGDNQAYCAPACGAPFYGMVPGCCECPPSPCDNAWAGYCEEKARWKAFWYRLGTGGATCSGPLPVTGPLGPAAGSCGSAGQPFPAVPVESDQPTEPAESAGPAKRSGFPQIPKPVPEDTIGKWKMPWFR